MATEHDLAGLAEQLFAIEEVPFKHESMDSDVIVAAILQQVQRVRRIVEGADLNAKMCRLLLLEEENKALRGRADRAEVEVQRLLGQIEVLKAQK